MAKFKAKILRRITVPVLKMKPNRPYYVRFEEPIHEGEKLENQKYDNAAQICKVLNFETGEISMMICRTVMKKEIERNYPKESYVHKSFELIYQNHPNPDVKYKLFTISEIAEPSPDDFNPTEENADPLDKDDFEPDQGEDDGFETASADDPSGVVPEADGEVESEDSGNSKSRSRNKSRSRATV